MPGHTERPPSVSKDVLRRLLVLLPCLVLAPVAWAGAPLPAPTGSVAPSTSAKAAARAAFVEGVHRYEAGDYVGARDKFAEAWALVPLAAVRWNLARCEEKLGRTATAWGLYQATAVDALAEGKPKIEAQASEAAALLDPKVPRLTVAVTPSGAIAKIDGESVPVGVAQRVDPGAHVVTAHLGDKAKKLTVVLADGDKKSVSLSL